MALIRIYRRIKPIHTSFELNNVYHSGSYMKYMIKMQNDLRRKINIKSPLIYSKAINVNEGRNFIESLGSTTNNTIKHTWFIEQNSWNTIYKSQQENKKSYMISRIWYQDQNMFHLMNYVNYKEYPKLFDELRMTDWNPSDVDMDSSIIMGYTGKKNKETGCESIKRHIGWESFNW